MAITPDSLWRSLNNSVDEITRRLRGLLSLKRDKRTKLVMNPELHLLAPCSHIFSLIIELNQAERFPWDVNRAVDVIMRLSEVFLKVQAWAEERIADQRNGHQAALVDACFCTELAYEYIKVINVLFECSPAGSIPLNKLKCLLAPCAVGLSAAPLFKQAIDGYSSGEGRSGSTITHKNQFLWCRGLHNFFLWLDHLGCVSVQDVIKVCWEELLSAENAIECLQQEALWDAMTVGTSCLSRAHTGPLDFAGLDFEPDVWLTYGSALGSIVQYIHLTDTPDDSEIKDIIGEDVLSSVDHLACIVETLHFIGKAKYLGPSDENRVRKRNSIVRESLQFFAQVLSKISQPLCHGNSRLASEENEAWQFAASMPVQKKVMEACRRLMEKGVADFLTPEDRAGLYSLVSNAAAMFAVFYIEATPGDGAYVRPPALDSASLMADAWYLYMEQVPACVSKPGFTIEMSWLARWPGLYVKTVFEKYESEEAMGDDKLAGSLMAAVASNDINAFSELLTSRVMRPGGDSQDAPSAAPVEQPIHRDEESLSLVLTTLDKLCAMGGTIPTFLQHTSELGVGRIVAILDDCIDSIYRKLIQRIADFGSEGMPFEGGVALCRQATGTAMTALKTALKLSAMPSSYLRKLNTTAHMVEDVDGLLIEIISGYTNLVLLKRAFESEEEIPSQCDQEIKALMLQVLYLLEKLPLRLKQHSELLDRIKALLGGAFDSKTCVKELLEPGDRGLTTALELAKGCLAQVRTGDANFGSEQAYVGPGGLTAQASRNVELIEKMQELVEKLQGLKRDVDSGGISEEQVERRAVKRAEVLAVLPCAFLGCTKILRDPVLGKIPTKKCSGCRKVRYCCVECQKADWKVHKVACRALAAARKAR